MSTKYFFYVMGLDMWADRMMWPSLVGLMHSNGLIKDYQYEMLKSFRFREEIDGAAYHDARYRHQIKDEWIRGSRPDDPLETQQLSKVKPQTLLDQLWKFEGATPEERTGIFFAISMSDDNSNRRLERISILRLTPEFQELFGINERYAILNDPLLGHDIEEDAEAFIIFIRAHARTLKTVTRRWLNRENEGSTLKEKYPFKWRELIRGNWLYHLHPGNLHEVVGR